MTLSGNILIIDDEPVLRKTLTRVLRQSGCHVTAAADGPTALQMLKNADYDLVYLDLRLPEMDGIEVLKEIQQHHAGLPVILLTAHASLQSSLDALRLGVTDYLIKPVDPETLIARTRVILAEQAIEQRRREIQKQIAILQSELKTLDQQTASSTTPPPVSQPTPEKRFIKRQKLILDTQTQRATFGENILVLPPTAFDYLAVLARHSPTVVPYQTLVVEAQGYETGRRQAQELTKWNIHLLRQALEENPKQPQYILNVRGTR